MPTSNSFWIVYSDYITLILTSFLAYWIYLKQEKKKRLGYNVLANTRLVEIHSKYENRLKIHFDNTEVSNVALILLYITNNGTEPLESKDFYTPIVVKFEGRARILLAEIFSKKPDDLYVPVEIIDDEVVIKPILLNSKEAFVLKLIVDTTDMNLIVTGRIAGVKQIEKGVSVAFDDKPTTTVLFQQLKKPSILILIFLFSASYIVSVINNGLTIRNTLELIVFLGIMYISAFEENYFTKRK